MFRYYTEYQWLLDFAAYSLVTYILSEIYIYLLPDRSAQEVNKFRILHVGGIFVGRGRF